MAAVNSPIRTRHLGIVRTILQSQRGIGYLSVRHLYEINFTFHYKRQTFIEPKLDEKYRRMLNNSSRLLGRRSHAQVPSSRTIIHPSPIIKKLKVYFFLMVR